MPFIIQGQDVAAVPATQSPWYEADIAILVAGIAGTGVLTGCGVTAQGTPDMTVAVASGTIQPSAGASAITVTGGNLTITTADATNPRIDLVSASAAGVKTVTDGTAAASPKPPDLPSGHVALAMIDVPASATAITTAQITDKRAMVFAATGGGGGSSPCPTLVQVKEAGTAATTITLGIAPASGHTLILAHQTQGGDLTSVSSTNTTWTKMYSASSSGGTRGIWVGVVSGTGGTTITVTWPGSYNSMTVAEITDTLTGTAGNTGINGQGVWQAVAGAAGHVVAATTSNSNTSNASNLWCSMPAVGLARAIVPLLITYSGGGQVSTTGDQDHINVEIT